MRKFRSILGRYMNNFVFLAVVGLLITQVTNVWLDLPAIWGWLTLTIFFNQFIIAIGGLVLVVIRYGFRRPNEKNYTNKTYIGRGLDVWNES